jgi:ribulose-phosphate 3-epimerase
MNKLTFGTSVICMDHINIERDVLLAEELGIDYLHMDIMDGNMVPRYGLYPEILQRIANITSMPMDIHLMVSDPEFAITQYADIENVVNITFHLDGNERDAIRIIDKIKKRNINAGIVLNMSSSFSSALRIASHGLLDSIMFMAIHPGVLKQTARPENLYKDIQRFFAQLDMVDGYKDELGPSFVQCDGGVTFETMKPLSDSGINNFVGGTGTIYKNVKRNESWEIQRKQTEENWIKIKDILAR